MTFDFVNLSILATWVSFTAGLKTYSNWPTYPQLYVNGELLGGVDIVKELVESGEFKDQLPKQESLEDRYMYFVVQIMFTIYM